MAEGILRVRGARTNNLRNIDIDIPRNKLVVVTGKSGSGKSSLAIDTIFAEGQRQFLESLSLYSRQFFNQSFGTDVDSIEGLPPTICINQNRGAANPRSTVATMTEIYDFLRLLFAKLGKIECPNCGVGVNPQSLDSICERILALEERTKVMVLANLVSSKKGKHNDTFEQIRKERLVRVRVDSEIHDIDSVRELNPNKYHTIDAVTDRIVVRDGIENRLRESVEMASKLSGGSVTTSYCVPGSKEWQEEFFSTQHACASCGFNCPELLPRTFSFNSPFGACATCEGLGTYEAFDLERLFADQDVPLNESVHAWPHISNKMSNKLLTQLNPLLKALNLDVDCVLASLPDELVAQVFDNDDRKTPGLIQVLEKEYATSMDDDWLEVLDSYRGPTTCAHCDGSRLSVFANSVKIGGRSISQYTSVQLNELIGQLGELQFDGPLQDVAETILTEVRYRLDYLIKVGLEYLTLDRSSDSLSGGELQRVRLAKSIGSGLTGACYVLDEPSIGLHARDNDRLINTIEELKDRTNSVIVVEHDEAMMKAADFLIDVGPDAGTDGGDVVFAGAWNAVEQSEKSLTGEYLSGRKTIERKPLNGKAEQFIELKGARGNNLKNISVQFQIGRLNSEQTTKI